MEVAEPAGLRKRTKRRREAAEFTMSTEPQLTRDRKIAAEPRRGPATLRNTEKISPCLSNTECCSDYDSMISGSDIKQPDKQATPMRVLTVMEEKKAWELEVEEFLSAAAETNDMERFTAKYNFDVVNDEPLVGRYEWVPLLP